jgi:hypothetical protein
MRFQKVVKVAATGALISLATISSVYAQAAENNVSSGIHYSTDLGPVEVRSDLGDDL